MSEAMLAMVIDLDVARHKREIADGFRIAREKLTPPPAPKSALQLLQEAMTNVAWTGAGGAYNSAMANMQNRWLQQSALAANPYNSGGAAWLGRPSLWPWSWPSSPYPF